jgi:hypothetical protein
METKTMLDDISTAIERVVKGLQSATTRMPLDTFVGYALGQIKKAAEDEPKVAGRRLSALKRSVDGALASLTKLNPEDTDSEKIEVEVLTAWVPSKGDGDKPEEELTAADDQSSKETSPVAVEPALSNSAFAQNLDEVAKALRRMRDELGGKQDGANGRTEAKKANDSWPLDLNNADFRKGVQKAEAPPDWGFDPDGVATPKG